MPTESAVTIIPLRELATPSHPSNIVTLSAIQRVIHCSHEDLLLWFTRQHNGGSLGGPSLIGCDTWQAIFLSSQLELPAGWRLDFNSFYISSELLRTRIIPAQQMLSRLFWRSTTSVLPLSPNLCENKMACDSSASLIASVYNVGRLYHWMSGLQNAAVQLLTTDGF